MLLELQSDLEGLLLSDPTLAEVPVLVERKGLTEEDVAQAIGVMNSREGVAKVGACIIVMMPVVRKPAQNASLQFATTATLRVLELPVVNQADGGIGLAAETISLRLLQLLHNWSPASGRTFAADGDAIEPTQAPESHIAYDVNITWTDGVDLPLKAPRPTIAYDAQTEEVTLTCSDADATLYYTTDGTFPYPENAGATIYAGPLSFAPGTNVRAIARRIGTDPYHTPKWLAAELEAALQSPAGRVVRDHPFSGSFVPTRYYRKDPRVLSIMIEVNRALYMDESTGRKNEHFPNTQKQLQSAIQGLQNRL